MKLGSFWWGKNKNGEEVLLVTQNWLAKILMKPVLIFGVKEKGKLPDDKIGDLYLTSGGRVVINRGWGESFTCPADTIILTADEVRSGIRLDRFEKRLAEAIKKRKKALSD